MRKTISEWIELYNSRSGKKLSYKTIMVRRAVSGIGERNQGLIGRPILVTEEEFVAICNTPVPFSKNITAANRI